MAVSSPLPIRRFMTSSLPATVSKYHEPSLRTSGMGIGQFWAPMFRTNRSSAFLTQRAYYPRDLAKEANSIASCFGRSAGGDRQVEIAKENRRARTKASPGDRRRRWKRGGQTAGSQPEREVPDFGDWAGRTQRGGRARALAPPGA